MRIAYLNKVDSAILQPDQEDSSYPIENVQDRRLGKVWKSTDGSTQSIIIDLGARKAIDTVAIMGHNFTSDSAVTIEGSDCILTSSAGSMIWADSPTLNPSQTTPETISYNSSMMLKFITSVSRRYWRLKSNLGTRIADFQYNSVCYSPELNLFCAVSSDATYRVITSPDGYTWTPRVTPTSPDTSQWYGICWSPKLSLFAAIAIDGTNRIMTSPNGIDWTLRTNSDGGYAICWSPELQIFCAVVSTKAYTSADGITWTSVTHGVSSTYRSIVWSAELNLFCAFGSGGTIITSPDGLTWTSQTSGEANDFYSACWSPALGLFVAVSIAGTNRIQYSSDGISWTEIAAPEDCEWRTVTWSKGLGKFISLASSGTNRAMYSIDGTTWVVSTPPAMAWSSITYSSELSLLVGVALSGTTKAATSLDGITWTAQSGVGTPIQIARLWLGEYITIDPSSLLDFKVTERDSDINIYGKDRQKFALEGVKWRKFELSFPPSENAMIEKISTMIDTVGFHSSFIFANFDIIRSYPIVDPCYVSLASDINFTHTERMHMNYSISMEEDL